MLVVQSVVVAVRVVVDIRLGQKLAVWDRDDGSGAKVKRDGVKEWLFILQRPWLVCARVSNLPIA